MPYDYDSDARDANWEMFHSIADFKSRGRILADVVIYLAPYVTTSVFKQAVRFAKIRKIETAFQKTLMVDNYATWRSLHGR